MISASSLSKSFGEIHALKDVSFNVAPGEILGFLGPNGAGKSTALRILSGFLPPSSGVASIGGFDVLADSIQARKHLGYLPEVFRAPPELRVSEYLFYRARLKGVGTRYLKDRVSFCRDLLGLGNRRTQLVGHLSKGFQQRLGLADALLADPSALLLDEPFSGLDPLQRQDLKGILLHLAHDEGKAILFSSHVLPEVEYLADRVHILHQGRTRADGDMDSLSSAAERCIVVLLAVDGDVEDVRQALLGNDAPDGLGEIEIQGGKLLIQLIQKGSKLSLLEWLIRERVEVLRFELMQPSLEDVFVQMTHGEDR